MPPTKRTQKTEQTAPAEPSEPTTPPAETVTPPAEPTADAPTTDEPADLTDAQRANLLTAAAANALEMLKGHTDNNPYHLATKNAPEWSPTMGEYIGAQLDGTKLYSGPVRPELEGEAGKWDKKNILPKAGAVEVRAKYASLPRLDAAVRHAQGCAAMGAKPTDAAMVFQPDRDALYEISVSESPLATTRRLAGKAVSASKTTTASADGLTKGQRSELDTLMRAVLKKAEKAHGTEGGWHVLLAAAAEEYGDKAPAAILASVERITKGRADSGQWIAAFAAVLRRPEEEEKAEETPPADTADQK